MRPALALTMGDPSGIGPEIIARTFTHKDIVEKARLIVLGDPNMMQLAIEGIRAELKLELIRDPEESSGEFGIISLIPVTDIKPDTFRYGQVDAEYGKAAFSYIEKSIDLAKKGKVLGVVTAPINKESLHLAGYQYSGHTEIFADKTGCSQYAMVLCNQNLRVIHVTTHVAMRNACDMITESRVYQVIELADRVLKELGISHAKIAVAGLNAHASENGLFGHEEQSSILPAIEKAQKKGISVEGPVPPDTVFVKAMAGQYDMVVAMYHDQGHIPVKLSGFRLNPETGKFDSCSGVNFTAGLPIIRTSVDHGTAFDKAGKFISNEESMIDAIDIAVKMAVHKLSTKEGCPI